MSTSPPASRPNRCTPYLWKTVENVYITAGSVTDQVYTLPLNDSRQRRPDTPLPAAGSSAAKRTSSCLVWRRLIKPQFAMSCVSALLLLVHSKDYSRIRRRCSFRHTDDRGNDIYRKLSQVVEDRAIGPTGGIKTFRRRRRRRRRWRRN